MTIEWASDSCPCVIQMVEGTFVFVTWTRRCQEHTALDGQPLLDAALGLNNGFNNQLNVTGNETRAERTAEVKRIHDMRDAEKARIIRSGATETR